MVRVTPSLRARWILRVTDTASPSHQRLPEGRARAWLAVAAVVALVAAYANHFGNQFHFDDFHTVTGNPAIRSLAAVPHFFADARTFSVLPSHQSYRPLVSASLALDYWIGGGLRPVAFHLSTFFWYLVQLALMYVLFLRVLDREYYPALFATALYGLHPVSAETVNYIVQRADLYATAGVVAGLVIYSALPGLRRWGLYLAPPLAGMLAKPSALVFAPILLVYILLFDRGRQESVTSCVRRAAPAFLVAAAYWIFQNAMTPATYVGSGVAPYQYWITQPYVALRYFRSFFLPFYLSADTDLRPFETMADPRAVAGCVFLLALAVAAAIAARHNGWRPVSFGLFWFLIGLAPAALVPLAEVENDHRMFLPFVGLTVSVVWTGWRLWRSRSMSSAALLIPAAVLIACIGGTRARNQVWSTEETLWLDVTKKSPANGRGWMNYGLTQMQKGELATAYGDFERARALSPGYSLVEVNLGVVSGALARHAEAEQHFRRAIELAPADSQSYFYYGRWLESRGRESEAVAALTRAASLNPSDPEPSRRLALLRSRPSGQRPEDYLDRSLAYYVAGRYQECIRAAEEALRLRPAYAEAYNNIAAGYQSMARWDEAIAAAEQAVRLKPDFLLARNNLRYARAQKSLSGHPLRSP